ncbi:MAG: cysteine methyltransferase [Thiotrichaceae bacterium]|nr:MAG: cysteine methyltransferase [Thiotrichaceae bacterium]
MSYNREKFDQAIWKTVSGIKKGRVMSYGTVARVSGFPRHARMVSRAMGRSVEPLPWYRVVRSNHTLAFEVDSETYRKQRRLLEEEGVKFIKGKVTPVELKDEVDLDKLLWGTEV